MKELSIEEKAKRYDEAIEKLRGMIPNWERLSYNGKTFLQDLVHIIPELKESDNEKIRKALIKLVKQAGEGYENVIDGVSIENAISWLEKQGEQKPTQEIEPTPIFRIGDTLKRKGKDYTFRVDRIQGGYYHCDRNHGAFFPIEEQGNWELVEQNPVDKVEPKFKVGNKIYLKPEYRMPDDDTPIANTVFEIKAIDDKHYRFDSSYIFIEDQDKYELVEQKPAWGEEDEKILNLVIARLHSHPNVEAEEYGKDYHWLKCLKDRVQPKQEWSEEDEEILDTIVCELEEVKKTLTEISYPAYDRLIAWLKSLRPQSTWKPSDEQIIALRWVLNNVPYNKHKEEISGLLEQIKDL